MGVNINEQTLFCILKGHSQYEKISWSENVVVYTTVKSNAYQYCHLMAFKAPILHRLQKVTTRACLHGTQDQGLSI